MAEAQVNGRQALNRENIHRCLLTSSTKRRISELHSFQLQIAEDAISPNDINYLLNLLFETYPLYIDRGSRQATQQCLRAIIATSHADAFFQILVKFLTNEAKKKSTAPANTFVLVEWCSILIQHLSKTPEQWSKYGISIVVPYAEILQLCLGSGTKESLKHSVIVVTRRALRAIFKHSTIGKDALLSIISSLTSKGTSPSTGNAPFLGIVSGVCARIPTMKIVLEDYKKHILTYYVREIVGSRTTLSPHITNGLYDFFQSFVTMDDLEKDILPAVEKSLLRAPEVVLNGLLVPMILSLDPELDLSSAFHKSLLKPLLSNSKSANAIIRTGSLATFEAAASRSRDTLTIEKIADEILTPLKQGKINSTEQRTINAQMLHALSGSAVVSAKIPLILAAVALKETNEPALAAEARAISTHMKYAFDNQIKLDKSVMDSFVKGLSDKKPSTRRIWSLQLGETLWEVSPEKLSHTDVVSFIQPTIAKLIEIWQDVLANPLPATQSGLVVVAYIVVSLLKNRLSGIDDPKLSEISKKAAISKNSLTVQPKPSFLLNHRVYSKLTLEADFIWNIRALAAVSKDVADANDTLVGDAWSHAFIYSVAASSIPSTVRRQAVLLLSQSYATAPKNLGRVIISGLWSWFQLIESTDKDNAAVAAKTGTSFLYLILQSICPPQEKETQLNPEFDRSALEDQLVQLLVLGRRELIPNASWIELCLRTGTDPGELVRKKLDICIEEIIQRTEGIVGHAFSAVCKAAYSAAADLAFVAPETATPRLISQLESDLDPSQLDDIGPTEAAIFRTPEGTAFIDVLAKKGQEYTVNKSAKDYDTLKWEEELRAQLAQKKGQVKKLTPDEQAKVNAQLVKESKIRKQVSIVEERMGRGVGIIKSLATGPPTEAESWFGPAVKLLLDAIRKGAGLILGEMPATAYIECANKTSSRFGPIRPFVGIATLRAVGTSHLPAGVLEEGLGDLITRVLYRLRFMSDQRPLDTVSLLYVLPLIFIVLLEGGIGGTSAEDTDEQIVLALEFLSYHMDSCSDVRLPRAELTTNLIACMQRYTQHYKLIKDCFSDLCRSLTVSIDQNEVLTLVKGVIVPEIPVRTSVLQAIDADIDLSDLDFCMEIWLACHDDVPENSELANSIWEESEFKLQSDTAYRTLDYLEEPDKQLRRAAARSLAHNLSSNRDSFHGTIERLKQTYREKANPPAPKREGVGLVRNAEVKDPWEGRDGIALAFKEFAPLFDPSEIVIFLQFLVHEGPLRDKSATVRDEMIEAATAVINIQGHLKVEELMSLFEEALEGPDRGSEAYDLVNEAVIILYGALARHLPSGDSRVPKVVQRLLDTLGTPSETVQYAVAQCLPALVQTSSQEVGNYVQQMLDTLLKSKKYAARRGAAYGLAGIVRGKGISALQEFRILSTLRGAAENKKDPNSRQGAFLAYELLSLILGRLFEPYVIHLMPQLLAGFGDTSVDVREACLDAAKTCFATLSSFGVKQILPTLLEGLEEQQWRSKKGACDLLGAMAYLDPQQLASSLPEIIPPLTNVLTDSHKEVRASANRSLQRFGEVISNPEIKSTVGILLKALSDPTKYTDDALDALIKVSFVHYLDAPSLALVVRILERGLGDRSATKRKAAQIIGSLAHLTERKDLISHLPILVSGLKVAIVDPVPTTRATASKALGSLVEKLGEESLPDLIPSLMATLKSDVGAGDRLGSAQALSEVLAGLGTSRLEETLPSILQNVSSPKPSVREGFMSLFIFLPACFGNSFANYLGKIIPPILGGLADDAEAIRETALRAGRLLVKNFASRAIDLLLPELERGLADDNYRIRLSSVELVGDLLFNLTGISAKAEGEDEEEDEETAKEAGQSLLEVLGEERRNKVLSALYICRCDTSGLVRSAAINVWKALVATPRTLRELIPTLTQLLIRRLASSNMEQKVIAGNALGELIRKAGEGVLATLLPTLEEGLHSTDTDVKQGICIALRELIASASVEVLEDYEKTLISVVRTALVDSDPEVRDAAAEAFDALQRVLGKRAVDQVLPYLLNLLRAENEAQNALAALLTLLTDNTRSSIILPNLLPTLLTSPMSAFNARAIASLAGVAGAAMTRRLPHILNSLMDNIVSCNDPELQSELDASFDAVLLSIDEFDGLNTTMSVMLTLVKHDDHRKRCSADLHLAHFFSNAEIDVSRYYPDLIRVLLIAFDDSDSDVVKAAWSALSELTKRLRKEEMESLVISTRQVLVQIGVAGSNLPGFLLPKGINAILPIFLQGLMNGTADQRTQAALAISDIIDRTSGEALRPFVTQITGPLIRVVSERSVEVKAAILFTLNNLLEKIPTYLKPFLPQLQRTFAKALADTSSEILRIRAAKALGTLITLTPRIDPLIAELVTGSKTSDQGVKNAMLKALFEVVSKAGANMNEASRNAILGLIDTDTDDDDDSMAITNARLLGALVKNLPQDIAESLIKTRVLVPQHTKSSVLALNAIILESPESLTEHFGEETIGVICQGLNQNQPAIVDNCILAAGKYLLTETSNKSFEVVKSLFEALAQVIQPGNPGDTRRLALVVVRTVGRENNEFVRPHLGILAPPIFASVRDMVIPVKLSAEAAFLAIFSVVDEETAVFDKYLAGAGANLAPNIKRSMQDYFKRVAIRLASQARERKEAEGGQGGLGLSSDEKEDEREVWSVGKVDLGEGAFSDE